MEHLDGRSRRAFDAIGNRGQLSWNTDDANAVRTLLAELRRLQRKMRD
jgi:hypothetical protein